MSFITQKELQDLAELFEKGIEYFNAKELPLAEKYFEKALKLEPERISILENLALVYFSNEKFENSENILNKIIKLEKDSPRVFNLMLKALKKQDKIKELKLYLDKELNQKNLHPKYKILEKFLYPLFFDNKNEIDLARQKFENSIDELDKISRTESGREIIGILTHITDSSQNDESRRNIFQGFFTFRSKNTAN